MKVRNVENHPHARTSDRNMSPCRSFSNYSMTQKACEAQAPPNFHLTVSISCPDSDILHGVTECLSDGSSSLVVRESRLRGLPPIRSLAFDTYPRTLPLIHPSIHFNLGTLWRNAWNSRVTRRNQSHWASRLFDEVNVTTIFWRHALIIQVRGVM